MCQLLSSDHVDAGLEILTSNAWRLVMVPEARRGEWGQEPAAPDQGLSTGAARARAQIP